MSAEPTDAQEQFNRQAANYAVSVPHATSDSLGIISELAAMGQYHLALDIATGPGFTAFAIADFCNTVIASDFAEAMLDQARKIADDRDIHNVRFEIIEAHDIPYPDKSIDLVTCRTAAHHFHDIPQFLSEVHRILKPDGIFLLCDTTTSENHELAQWHQRVEAERDPSHVAAPSPSQWSTLITDARFKITHNQATQVNMTFNHWVKRSGTSQQTSQSLHRDFVTASNQLKREYGIQEISDDDIVFHWPVLVCRAVKD